MSKVRERHGVADLRCASASNLSQHVTVVDVADDQIALYLARSDYGALMTPKEALVLAEQLMDAAERVSTQTKERPPRDEGRAKGGHARAAALSPERRKEIASHAALGRWGKEAKEKAND